MAISFQPLLFSGLTLGSSASFAIGSPISGADPNAVLTTDGSSNLSDKVLTNGTILIGSTGAAPVVATLTGTANQVTVTQGPGSITLSLPQSIATTSTPTFASLLVSPSGSLDTTATGTLAIGTSNANIINIGNSGATVNIQGTVLYENVTQLQVKDPLITLNKGGGAGSASNSGIELEEAGTITAYAETSADRASWSFKAPSTTGIALITPGSSGITLNQSSHNPVTLGTANGLSLSTQALSLAVATASQTGALLNSDWTIFNNKQPAGNYVTALTGDGTATGPGSVPFTLATVNASPGTFGSTSTVNAITVNAKGLVTSVTNSAIQITESQVTNLVSDLAGKQPVGNYVTSITGDATGSGPGATAITLATVNGSPGSTGSASSTSVITTNAKGLVTSNSSTPIQITEAQVINLTSDLAGKQPTGNYLTALSGDITAAGPGSSVATLATVNASPGTTGSASNTSTITVNAKGLVTSSTNTPIQITESQVTNLTTDLASKLTSVSVASSNGLAGTSSGGSTPTLTLSTTVTGVLKGNGTAISAATAGTDYQAPITLTTTGTSGVATFTGNTLNIPNYQPGTGTVTSVSVVSANGFAGTVATPTTTPAITVSTSITGLLKGNGTAVSAAIAGTDYQAPGNYVTALTGDGSAAGPGSAAFTLATVNASPGTFGSASTVNTIVVNGKGLVTSVTNSNIQIAESQVTNLTTDLAGKQPTGNYLTSLTGDVTASGPGAGAATLATVNASPGTFGSTSTVNTVTVNGKGLVTSVTNSSIQIAESQVTNLVSDLAGKQPTGNYITALTGDASASGPGSAAITLATVNSNVGTFNNVTVNGKGLVTAASNVSYAPASAGDVNPGSYSGLANNTANQSITGLSFATSVSTFEALLNIQISATTNTFTTVKVFGTNKSTATTWAGGDISPQFMGDAITGLSFGITAAGTLTISIGSIAGFTSGIIKYRAISLS